MTSLWLQFPAVFQILNSTVWQTLLVHSVLKQLPIWKPEWASNFISFHILRCNPFLGPLELCRTLSGEMGKGKEVRPNCDIQPKFNSLKTFQLCRRHCCFKTKNNKLDSSCSLLSQEVAWQPCKVGEAKVWDSGRRVGLALLWMPRKPVEEPHHYRWWAWHPPYGSFKDP